MYTHYVYGKVAPEDCKLGSEELPPNDALNTSTSTSQPKDSIPLIPVVADKDKDKDSESKQTDSLLVNSKKSRFTVKTVLKEVNSTKLSSLLLLLLYRGFSY